MRSKVTLGEAGRRVLVLEKETLPRYKPCGGGVPKAVFERFAFDLSPVVERWVRRVRFRFRDGREVVADLPDRCVAMVMRDQFDFLILRHARAEVRDNSCVVSLEQDEHGVEVAVDSGEIFRGYYLVAADGANSRVARLVGLRQGKWMGGAIEVEVPADDCPLEEYAGTALFVFGTPSKGYLWVFPKAEHLSVGIGFFRERVSNMRGILRREMGRLGIQIDGARPCGHPLPIHLKRERIHQGRVLLAGDAAGLMDPLLGEGIRPAIDGGHLAAKAVLTDDLHDYTQQVHREMGADLLWGSRWARLFYNHPRTSFELGVRNPLLLQEFLRLFAGRTTYRRMAMRAPFKVLRGLGRRLPARPE